MKTQPTPNQLNDAGFTDEYHAAVIALCEHLDCEPSDLSLERHEHYGLSVFSLGNAEYAIGTDEQADDACEQYIRDSVWAFNASFILSECGLPHQLEEAIGAFQEKECEDANDALLALVEKCCKGGIAGFTCSAVSADGRGHFLSPYDGCETKINSLFIYRIN